MSAFIQLSKNKVVAIFGSPQDPEEFPDVIEVEEDDPRIKDYWDKWAEFGVRRPS